MCWGGGGGDLTVPSSWIQKNPEVLWNLVSLWFCGLAELKESGLGCLPQHRDRLGWTGTKLEASSRHAAALVPATFFTCAHCSHCQLDVIVFIPLRENTTQSTKSSKYIPAFLALFFFFSTRPRLNVAGTTARVQISHLQTQGW